MTIPMRIASPLLSVRLAGCLFFLSIGAGGLTGCGAAPEPKAPTPPGPTAEPSATPAGPTAAGAKRAPIAVPDGPRDPATPAAPPPPVKLDAWEKATKVKGVPIAPATCGAFAKRVPAAQPPANVAAALSETDPAKRDALLAAMEKGHEKSDDAVRVRVLRAELAPTECADVVTDPLLVGRADIGGQAGHALVGLSLAAKLARTAASAPTTKATDKESLKKFIQGPLRAWVVEQASAIEALSQPAGALTGHGRGVVGIEAGVADLRLVDQIRSSPTPKTWDTELKGVYEAALDEALEPRKTRGRDAALVGLSDFASEGVLVDRRIDRARTLLSKLYGGRRIDALDGLMLPDWEAPRAHASDVPIAVLPGAVFEPHASLQHHPRARLDLGRRYWRRVDFVESAQAAKAETAADARFTLALAVTLARGPASAKEMMLAPSPSALALGSTEALDAFVEGAAHSAEEAKLAGMAAYDAAHLRALAPPEGDALGPYLADVAARFKRAASLLEDPALKKRAEERAAEAETIAKAAAKK